MLEAGHQGDVREPGNQVRATACLFQVRIGDARDPLGGSFAWTYKVGEIAIATVRIFRHHRGVESVSPGNGTRIDRREGMPTGDMHKERIAKYVTRLAEVVDGATAAFDKPIPIPRPRTDGDISYALGDEVHRKKINIVSDLLKNEGWIKKFSQEYVDRRIGDIVSKNVGSADNSGIEPMFLKLLQDFTGFTKVNTVLIPLDGIVLKVPEIRLGKIRLVTATTEYLEKLREDVDRYSKEARGDKEIKAERLRQLNEMIDQFRESVCAERVVVAESARAREIARDELRLTVAILNFLADALSPKFHEIRVGLKGEFFRGLRIELTREHDSIEWQQMTIGPRAPLSIDDKALALMKGLKIQELADLVTEDEFDAEETFEGTILTAIHFHSHARELPDRADKVLTLTTAIESFFETSQKSIAATIANGCALVLCNNLEDRLKMKSLIKRLYRLRSSISHFGRRTVVERDLGEMSFISWQLICFAIKNRSRFESKAEFNSWVEKLEMGLPNELSIVTF